MPAPVDKDDTVRRDARPAKEERPRREAVEDVRIDRLDVDWSDGGIPDFIGRLPLRIHQAGNANDLSVQINVAMLPPVEDFRGYEAAAPGAGQYIMRAADEQRQHRFAIETCLVQGSERRRNHGQILSAALSLTGLVGAVVLGLFGNGWVAGILAVVAVGGPLAAQTLAGLIAQAEGSNRRGGQVVPSKAPDPGDKPDQDA